MTKEFRVGETLDFLEGRGLSPNLYLAIMDILEFHNWQGQRGNLEHVRYFLSREIERMKKEEVEITTGEWEAESDGS